MEGYDDGPRPLTWPLRNPLVDRVIVEDDGDCEPSSFIWPDDPDERTVVPFYLSLNEYNILGSTIDVGSDIAFGEDALRVMWLWMRNFRCNVPICDAIIACIEDNPATITAIVNNLILNTEFNQYLTQQITNISPPVGGNLYPARPTAATPDPLCNAATYVVGKIRELIVGIYNDLETLTPQEALEALLGLFGWQSGPLYQLIGLLETNDETALLAAFDAASDDIICQLVEDELDQTAILAWIATTYPPPSVLGDALTRGVEAAADDGKYAQWIAVGATMTGALCCEPPPPPDECDDLTTAAHGFTDSGQTKWYTGQGIGPTHAGGVEQFYINRPNQPGSLSITGLSITFNMAFTGVTIQLGGFGQATVNTVANVATINESTHPALFPINVNALVLNVRSAAASWIVPSGALRMIEICFDPV